MFSRSRAATGSSCNRAGGGTATTEARVWLRCLLLLVAGPALMACGEDPGQGFHRLEEELLQGPELRVRFNITSEGAFTADLKGELFLEAGGVASLKGDGRFGETPASFFLMASDGSMRWGNGEGAFEEPAPPGLREALVIGLTRMGLLHNLARLVAGSPPERADGSVREWVQVREVAWEPPGAVGPAAMGLRFEIWVGGQPAGEATLWLDEGGRPVLREQVVRFPSGDMRVVERYETG